MQIIGTVLVAIIANFALSGLEITTLFKALLVGVLSVVTFVVLGKIKPSSK